MKQRQALKNYADVSICNDLMLLHNMRTNIWNAILRYQGTEMEKELQKSFDVLSDTFEKLEAYEPQLPSNK